MNMQTNGNMSYLKHNEVGKRGLASDTTCPNESLVKFQDDYESLLMAYSTEINRLKQSINNLLPTASNKNEDYILPQSVTSIYPCNNRRSFSFSEQLEDLYITPKASEYDKESTDKLLDDIGNFITEYFDDLEPVTPDIFGPDTSVSSSTMADISETKKNYHASISQEIDDSDSSCQKQSPDEKWMIQFQELIRFKSQYGHCSVPHEWQNNLQLASWVKRQRYQYKLKREGKYCALTDERQKALDKIGFVWQSQTVVWEERFQELLWFKEENGHCNVPTVYPTNPQLAVWVKCQRRQYKLYKCGRTNEATKDRMKRLFEIGFNFDPRGLKK